MIPGLFHIFLLYAPPKKIQMNLFQKLKILVDFSGLHFNVFLKNLKYIYFFKNIQM